MSEQPEIRPESTSSETEKRELEWWQKFADLENRFAWVQGTAMQRILRGRYLCEIVKYAGAKGRTLELGCGVGWLCFNLAEFGASEVFGVDFSPSQIAIAQERAKTIGLADRVHFCCADGTQDNVFAGQFDCVVVHGFLHHLNKTEIRRTMASVPKFLKPNGAFIVFEPVLHEGKPAQTFPLKLRCLLKCQYVLTQLANRGQRFGFRRISQEERSWRDLFSCRAWGVPPHGPSPKEMPFAPGELEGYLSSHFVIERQVVCMAISHLIVQEWLLREVSHPYSSRLLLPWVARAAAWIDRGLVQQVEMLPTSWIFKMWICRLLAKDFSSTSPP